MGCVLRKVKNTSWSWRRADDRARVERADPPVPIAVGLTAVGVALVLVTIVLGG